MFEDGWQKNCEEAEARRKEYKKTPEYRAERASYDADVNGITGFMHGCAVNVLSQVWKYGEELRIWHNKKYGHEGDGVVNPAVLTISVG